jgi:hypothetical protein
MTEIDNILLSEDDQARCRDNRTSAQKPLQLSNTRLQLAHVTRACAAAGPSAGGGAGDARVKR